LCSDKYVQSASGSQKLFLVFITIKQATSIAIHHWFSVTLSFLKVQTETLDSVSFSDFVQAAVLIQDVLQKVEVRGAMAPETATTIDTKSQILYGRTPNFLQNKFQDGISKQNREEFLKNLLLWCCSR
jgi:hypothetical protein